MTKIMMNFLRVYLLALLFRFYSCQKAPNNGRYCGTLQEIQFPGKLRFYNCQGVVWAMDGRRLKLSGFTFQQSYFLPENITFWIGPAVKTGNELLDIIPSANGFYLEAKSIPPKLFAYANTPVIIAKKPSVKEVSLIKLRQNTNAVEASTLPTNSSVVTNSTKNDTSPAPEPAPSTTPVIRVPREAGIPEPEPRKSPAENIAPAPENVKKSSDTVVPTAEPSKNSSTNISTLASSTVGNVSESNTHPNKNVSIIVADAFESVQNVRKQQEDSFVSNSSQRQGNKIIFEFPFNKQDTGGQIIPESSRTVAISIILATTNSTQPYNLITQGTPLHNGSVSSFQQTTVSNGTRNFETNETIVASDEDINPNLNKIWKQLQWNSGADEIILDLPSKKHLSDFRWLSVYDHTNQQPIATLLLPNGKGFFVPAPLTLKGFKPTLRTKDVHSTSIQILDTKTIRINNFSFEGDAPGAWFMVGTSLFPTLTGRIVPILKKDGTYDCDYLQAYNNQTITLKLPGTMDTSDVFWLSVFCVPYSISFAHVYLPYKDLSVPISLATETVPYCMFEGIF